MNDIEKKNDFPSTTSLSKLGVTAVGYTVGGIFLMILPMLTRIPFLGIAVGGIVSLIGIGSLLSKDPADKKAGIIITAAGALTLLSKIPPFQVISSTLLAIGAVGLLALGIWKGIKFFIGLKKRS
ncbi:MAG: hypothetical protein FWB86_12495 [Treponema sp.]|nr:hypothetical protein [Treponema sp.]MCL2252444.1 hypothetical protein [Treponema sp.]